MIIDAERCVALAINVYYAKDFTILTLFVLKEYKLLMAIFTKTNLY